VVPVDHSHGWIAELHEDIGEAFPDLLQGEDEVYVCTSWEARDGSTIEAMHGQEAADDFSRLYGEGRLQDLHVRQENGTQQYDVVLETDSHEAITDYLESRERPVPDSEGLEGLRVRYTNDIHEE
jgi:hypothetical protein